MKKDIYWFIKIFLDTKFITFIVIGCINAFNGIMFAYLYSIIINPNIAFILGYITSLVISYFLNSVITFKDSNFKLNKFIKFCISYIPNFIIQMICVVVLLNTFHVYKLITYIISAAIGIPITYLFLLLFAFKNQNIKR